MRSRRGRSERLYRDDDGGGSVALLGVAEVDIPHSP